LRLLVKCKTLNLTLQFKRGYQKLPDTLPVRVWQRSLLMVDSA
jgi:hypothetical protein